MKVLYLHGWNSVVGGVKPTYLKSHGHEVIEPALNHEDFQAALETAQRAFNEHQPEVVVGSSRGGAVAVNMDSGSARFVLICPAWKKWGTATTVKPGTEILHSRADDVVQREHHCPGARRYQSWLTPLLRCGQSCGSLLGSLVDRTHVEAYQVRLLKNGGSALRPTDSAGQLLQLRR